VKAPSEDGEIAFETLICLVMVPLWSSTVDAIDEGEDGQVEIDRFLSVF
jgi:hypothetical protein